MTKEARICNEEKIASSIDSVGKTGPIHAKQSNQSTFSHHIQKWTENGLKTNVRPKTINLPEENIGSKFFDIGLINIFGSVSSGKGSQSKNKQTGLCQTKRLLHSEGKYQQNEKVAYWMREDTCKQCIW